MAVQFMLQEPMQIFQPAILLEALLRIIMVVPYMLPVKIPTLKSPTSLQPVLQILETRRLVVQSIFKVQMQSSRSQNSMTVRQVKVEVPFTHTVTMQKSRIPHSTQAQQNTVEQST